MKNRQSFLGFLFILSINTIVASLLKKNIIIITVEELGFNDVGFHGSNEIKTPNIDALAYSGLILKNYYVQPLASLSMYALLTGQFPIHTGMYNNKLADSTFLDLSLKDNILAQDLEKMGYTNHLVGKWYLGKWRRNTPFFNGFHSHLGYLSGDHDYYDHVNINSSKFEIELLRNGEIAYDLHGKHATDIFTDEAVKIINNHDYKNPLFLHVAHGALHPGSSYNPLPTTAEEISNYYYIEDPKRRRYAAMVTKIDKSVGKIVYALEKKQLLDHCIIIFTTTSGGSHESTRASNYPFRGGKGNLWEGGIRGAAFVWMSKSLDPNREIPMPKVILALMHIVDWRPTLTTEIKKWKDTDVPNHDYETQKRGVSNWAALAEKPSERIMLVHNAPADKSQSNDSYAMTLGFWKLLINSSPYEAGSYHIQNVPVSSRNYDLTSVLNSLAAQTLKRIKRMTPLDEIFELRAHATIKCPDSFNATYCIKEEPCLFDVFMEPCENVNLASKYPDMVEKLESLLAEMTEDHVKSEEFQTNSYFNFDHVPSMNPDNKMLLYTVIVIIVVPLVISIYRFGIHVFFHIFNISMYHQL